MKDKAQNLLYRTKYYELAKSEYLITLQDKLQKIIKACQNNLRVQIENHINEKYSNEETITYLKTILELRQTNSELLKEIGIDIDKIIQDSITLYQKELEDIKDNSSIIEFTILYNNILLLNSVLEIFPTNNTLQQCLKDALSLVFPNFIYYMDENQLNELIIHAKYDDKEIYRAMYTLFNRLNDIEEIKDRYCNGDYSISIEDKLNSIIAIVPEKNKEIQDICVKRIKSLADFFNTQKDFENELWVLEFLIQRMHISEQEILKRRDICKLNNKIAEFSHIKKELKQYLNQYRDMAQKVTSNDSDINAIEEFLQNDNYVKNLYETYSKYLRDMPGTPLTEWKDSLYNYSTIILESYQKILLDSIQYYGPDNLTHVCTYVTKYIKSFPTRFIRVQEIRDTLKGILEKDPGSRTQVEHNILCISGIDNKDTLEKLNLMQNSEDIEYRKQIANELLFRATEPLHTFLNSSLNSIHQEEVRTESQDWLRSIDSCYSREPYQQIELIGRFHEQYIQDKHTEPFLPIDIYQKYLSSVQSIVNNIVTYLSDEIKNENYTNVEHFLDNIPEFLLAHLHKNLTYHTHIYPQITSFRLERTINDISGQAHTLEYRHFNDLVQQINSLISSRPNKAIELKNALWQELSENESLSEETKKQYFSILSS